MLIVADLINTIIQATLLGYIPYYCIKKDRNIKDKNDYIKLIMSIISIFIGIKILTATIGGISLSTILMNIMCMVILCCFYFNNYEKAIIAYSITYLSMQISSIVFSNIRWSYIQNIVSVEHTGIYTLLFLYMPIILMEVLMILNIKKVYALYKLIKRKKYGLEMSVMIIFLLDMVMSVSFIIHGNDTVFFKNLFIIFLVVFVAILSLYFINIKNKMDEISKLNEALQIKNNELKKVKHDYGSQISYINGLYIMDQYDRLGDVLQGIITGNNSVSGNLKVLSNSESIISVIINSLVTEDINVIVEEEYDISNLNISEYDLQKIISNIISNSVTAVGENGLIIIKTYKIFGNIYIAIKNNGPKIDDEMIDKIFEPGFTTKSTSDNGFGLSIVKDLVKANEGELCVSSTNDYTEFKIIFKVKNR